MSRTKAAFRTDRGRKRSINEDALFCRNESSFYMVADGVGGHNAGELASSLAAELVGSYVKHRPVEDVRTEDELKDYFFDCLSEANESVSRVAQQREGKVGMATTALLTYIWNGKAFVVNLGDSRAYLLRDGCLMRITEDHSYVNQLLKEGSITEEEALVHPKRNVITRAIGADESIEPDFFQFEVYPGDRILLCTDGLYNEVPEEEICGVIAAYEDVEDAADELVRRAAEYGGSDNITVICIAILN